MLNMQNQAASASPVALRAPGNPAVEDWDAMMRALRQRIGTIAATSPAALSSAQRRDSLSDCGLALAQLNAQLDRLDRLDAAPATHRQREHELKQAAHLLARAQRVSVDGGGSGGSGSTSAG